MAMHLTLDSNGGGGGGGWADIASIYWALQNTQSSANNVQQHGLG